MKPHHSSKPLLIAAALFMTPLAHAANMTNAQYYEAKNQISATYNTDKAACASLARNSKDVCVEEARGKEKVARAQLQHQFSGKPSDQTKLAIAKADSTYGIAKEKCDDLAGNGKDVCVKEAKATQIKSLADVKAGREIGEARTDSSAEKRRADFSVAKEKCDALAGEAKNNCLASAKSKFGN